MDSWKRTWENITARNATVRTKREIVSLLGRFMQWAQIACAVMRVVSLYPAQMRLTTDNRAIVSRYKAPRSRVQDVAEARVCLNGSQGVGFCGEALFIRPKQHAFGNLPTDAGIGNGDAIGQL